MTSLAIRPVGRGESGVVATVFDGLSDRSRRLRFLRPMPQLAPPELERLADVGGRGREAVVATSDDEPIGIARYVRDESEPDVAEVAFAVVDSWQGRGIGRLLGAALRRRAAYDGIRRFRGLVALENRPALALMRGLGDVERTTMEAGAIELTIRLLR
jgi:GNAT superfamily N-acetyltransferase